MANARLRLNTLDKLEIDGVEFSDSDAIKEEIITFYKQLYSEYDSWRPSFIIQNQPTITDEEKLWLERPFKEQEVLHSIRLYAEDKAPDPDGYSIGFIRACWVFLKIGRAFGPEFLLKLYLSGAVAGSVFYLLYHAFIVPSLQTQRRQVLSTHPSQVPGLGASGAVNAVMLLDIFLFPRKTLYLDFIVPVPAILLGIFIIGKDVLRIWEGDTQISGSAHLGGAVMAAIAWARVRRGRF